METINELRIVRDLLKADMLKAKKAKNKEIYEHLKWEYEQVCDNIRRIKMYG